MKGIDDDHDSSKKHDEICCFPVTIDSPTQKHKKTTKRTASKKKWLEKRPSSGTSSLHQSTCHISNEYNHTDLSQNDVAHHNSTVTAESMVYLEKQRIAGRQVMDSIPKQGEFAEEATIEEMTQDIHNVKITGSAQFGKKQITDGLFYKEGCVKEAIFVQIMLKSKACRN